MSSIAWGISPYKSVIIPLEDYNINHYLTLVYQAMLNRGWHIDYFDRDGIMAYTNISLESYAEEVSVRIINNHAVIKSECIGIQSLFNDYGKNQKNIDLLLDEIIYADFHLRNDLDQTAQQMMDSVPENQFASLALPPMGGKEKLHSFLSVFTPQESYFITPILVLINIAVYIITTVAMSILIIKSYQFEGPNSVGNIYEKVFSIMGFSERTHILNGQYWRLLTNTFLHFSILHLAGNMITLIYIGSIIESKVGKWNYLFLYLFTGIAASMVSVMWREQGFSAGASGAIFGLFGIFLALLSTDLYERNVRKAMLISTVIIVVLYINPFKGDDIDHAAHFGGLIFGYIFGLITYAGLKTRNIIFKRYGISVILSLLVVVFIAVGYAYAPRYELKKFNSLKEDTQKLSGELNEYFYNDNDITRNAKLATIERKGLPTIKKFNIIANEFEHLTLPEKQEREAKIRAKIIVLQCRYYQLLYQEFKERNTVKYRPEITRITDKINSLRIEWGTFAQDE